MTSALEMGSDQCTFWSDSMIVSCCISLRSRSFKPIVANRVGEIQPTWNQKQWSRVPTELNPAVMISSVTVCK